jgi:hypothetical protein
MARLPATSRRRDQREANNHLNLLARLELVVGGHATTPRWRRIGHGASFRGGNVLDWLHGGRYARPRQHAVTTEPNLPPENYTYMMYTSFCIFRISPDRQRWYKFRGQLYGLEKELI